MCEKYKTNTDNALKGSHLYFKRRVLKSEPGIEPWTSSSLE